ncbi:MAG TPA: hypothetical protein VHD63_15020, partial [Ktedonobacteraceae bacterium]|nr:hypothetical protein [Ktedonobacteraceae bacterium]
MSVKMEDYSGVMDGARRIMPSMMIRRVSSVMRSRDTACSSWLHSMALPKMAQLSTRTRVVSETVSCCAYVACFSQVESNSASSSYEETGFRLYQPFDHLLLRMIYLARGDEEQARLHTQRATALANEMGYPELVSSMPDIRQLLSEQPGEA